MGLLDVAQSGYQPKENQEFGGRKKLIGDAVCEVKLESIISKKGKKWYLLKGEAINVIADPKGRPTTVEVGDEITRMYDPDEHEDVQELADDLFTAGISYQNGADEDSTFSNAKSATDGKLVYFRTWAKDKTAEQIKSSKEGSPSYYQNIKVLSVNKLTPENSTPQVAF